MRWSADMAGGPRKLSDGWMAGARSTRGWLCRNTPGIPHMHAPTPPAPHLHAHVDVAVHGVLCGVGSQLGVWAAAAGRWAGQEEAGGGGRLRPRPGSTTAAVALAPHMRRQHPHQAPGSGRRAAAGVRRRAHCSQATSVTAAPSVWLSPSTITAAVRGPTTMGLRRADVTSRFSYGLALTPCATPDFQYRPSAGGAGGRGKRWACLNWCAAADETAEAGRGAACERAAGGRGGRGGPRTRRVGRVWQLVVEHSVKAGLVPLVLQAGTRTNDRCRGSLLAGSAPANTLLKSCPS